VVLIHQVVELMIIGGRGNREGNRESCCRAREWTDVDNNFDVLNVLTLVGRVCLLGIKVDY
jgi:hypothetical protein